jgi:hypothetical protein
VQTSGEVPRQEFLDTGDGVIGDMGQHMPQIGFGIEAVELGGSCRVSDYAEAEHTVLSWY